MVEGYKTFCLERQLDIPLNLKGETEYNFKMDVESLLSFYNGLFTKAGLERITGINQKQLWHYSSGRVSPRETQVEKMQNAIRKLGEELISITLCSTSSE